MIIYKITNLINGKVYIGQTINSLRERWSDHKYYAISTDLSYHLYNSMREYDIKNFKIEEIDSVNSQEELNEKEIYWINFYDSLNPEKGYNQREGGYKGQITDEGIKKMLESRKKYYEKPENKEKISKRMMEKWKDPIYKEEMTNKLNEGKKRYWKEKKDLKEEKLKSLQNSYNLYSKNREKIFKKAKQENDFKNMKYEDLYKKAREFNISNGSYIYKEELIKKLEMVIID